MTYDLYIADRTFSSWSLRGWLMLEKFGLPYRTHMVGLYTGTMAEDLAPVAPARTLPVLKTPEGYILTDSIAIAETLAERHPDVGLWPKDPAARAMARNLVAEMHSGFTALRGACPGNIAFRWLGFVPQQPELDDLARISSLWRLARARHGTDSPWLFGEYSLADIYYAPVACRIATYGLPVDDDARAYVNAHLADPAFLQWKKDSLTEHYDPFPYDFPALSKGDWPSAI